MAAVEKDDGARQQPAQARKRRIERRAKLKTLVGAGACEGSDRKRHFEEIDEGSESDATSKSTRTLDPTKGVKKGARYVPDTDVPMSRDELAAWRKEARRVRNRESAAASRQKTRKRIEELEDEVSDVKSLYQAALRRIADLEAMAASSGLAPPAYKQKDLARDVSQARSTAPSTSSPLMEPHKPHTVSPPLSPRDSFQLNPEEEQPIHDGDLQYQHFNASSAA